MQDTRSLKDLLKPTKYGEVETSSEFLMAAQVLEVESCENHNVAGLSLELECLDDGQGTERDKIASWSANWTSLDREGQHERSDCRQRTCAQLGRSCGKVGPERNLCEALRCRGL